MKIGILTYHRSLNYGALLQAKALQDFVRGLGHDVSIVDYWPLYHEDMYKPFSWKLFNRYSIRWKVEYLLKFLFTFIRLNLRRSRTREYIKKYLTVTDNKIFDIVLYGSDQIWRKQHQPACEWYNPVYWGEGFVQTTHRIAYAASMGRIEIENTKDLFFIKHHLDQFDAIGLREKDLIDRFLQEFSIEYPMVCDPVFLLTKEQWTKHVDKKYIPKCNYILYYRLQDLEATDRMVEDLHKKTGYDIIELRGRIPFFHYGRRYRYTADAQEFLSLIYGANYVVTSSFHGISLSIIFEKQFLFASQKKVANRVFSLLNQLGLESRFFDGGNDIIDIVDNPIDYAPVRRAGYMFASQSREWLSRQLENCKTQS